MQVYLHYSVATAGGRILQSTRVEEGGTGLPLAFVIGKGCRVPRGWELALLGVCRVCTCSDCRLISCCWLGTLRVGLRR